jgi:iron complex outermembrane receptor protein
MLARSGQSGGRFGGALTIEMKNGFTYQGKEIEAMGGSYGRQ